MVEPPAGTPVPRNVVAVDLGIKAMTPELMAQRGMRVTVVPATMTAAEILAKKPDGVFFSNGPGDPGADDESVATLRGVLEARVPFFGICYGNQILGRALGYGTYKLQFGHRGINQPVVDRTTGKVEITAHNHGFAVDAPLDGDIGIACRIWQGAREPREPQRRRRGGPRMPRHPRVLRAVPPGGGGRPARCRVPL